MDKVLKQDSSKFITLSSEPLRIKKGIDHFGDLRVVAKYKAVPLHVMKALGGRGNIAPTYSQHRH
jgi:hypothetical protein